MSGPRRPEPERWLGDYRLVRRIAVGGMAEVFEGRRRGTDDPVVLKVVLPQYGSDPEFVQMLADEARLSARLDHPNLVRVHELGHDGGQHYLVMEHVAGTTLAALIERARALGGPPAPRLALAICRPLLDALVYLQGLTDEEGTSLEVVHRDVTPANVLLSREGQVKLGDFGIARHRLRAVRTRTGVIKGTVQYMAPEQLTGSGTDARADLYGVGLILFELLTLRAFISAESEVELLRLAEAPPWTPPSRLRPDLDPALDRLVERALRRFPEERYPTAEAFLAALDRTDAELAADDDARPDVAQWVADLEAHAPAAAAQLPTIAPGRPATQVAPAPVGRARPLLWALLLALPVAVAGGIWALLADKGAAPVDAGPALGLDAAMPDAPLARADARHATPPDARPDLSPPADLRPTPRPRPRPRPPRVPVVAPPVARPDAAAPAPAPVPQRRKELVARYRALRSTLERRGILPADLPGAVAARLQSLGTALERDDAGKDPALAQELDRLERQVAGARVSKKLVEAKLQRVDRLLRQAKGVPRDLRDRASLALQEFMDGRYEEANRQLNRILRALGAGG